MHLEPENAPKWVGGRDFAQDPHWGSLQRSLDPIGGFKEEIGEEMDGIWGGEGENGLGKMGRKGLRRGIREERRKGGDSLPDHF